MVKDDVTAERLRELLHYDPLTGIFTRIKKRGPKTIAGCVTKRGRVQICVDGKLYFAHRIAFAYMTGQWPIFQVDHKDGNNGNNKWDNLRDATPSVNGQNRHAAQSNSKVGMLGVCEHQGRFMASIRLNGKTIYLGMFDTPESAHSAYLKSKREIHPGCTI